MSKRFISISAGALACLMVVMLLAGALPLHANAASSSEIRSKISSLEAEASAIQAQQADLNAQIVQNTSDIKDVLNQKDIIDQEIQLLHQQIDNNNEQIQSYNQLISDMQDELDDSLARQEELNEAYRTRLRAMEENGNVSYWSILFKANSFLDLLDQINMIAEIAKQDQEMLADLRAVAEEIAAAQEQLEADKSDLKAVKEGLEASEAELDEKREQSNQLFAELMEHSDELEAYYAEQSELLKDVDAQIAAQELAYTKALQAEEEARREAEEAAKPTTPSSTEEPEETEEPGNSEESSDPEEPEENNSGSATSGFAWPSSVHTITSSYGYRNSPSGDGRGTWHTGIDIGASRGSPIYASKSGTVTTAGWSTTGYGNHVIINHGDGSSTLYGHMTNYIVSAGQYVTQGQIIGYVGDTGYAFGAHLHFTIYINGSTVNPLLYLP